MRFVISIGGDHAEGHEGRGRFDALVRSFVGSLRTNGFLVDQEVATHDFGTLIAEHEEADAALAVLDATETSGEQAATLTVSFASATAAKLADEHNLTDTDFVGIEPSGANGFVTDDVREAIKAKQ